MKEALLVLVRRKEELEGTNNQLEAELKERSSLVTELSEQVERLKEDFSNMRDSQAHQNQSLERYSGRK